MAAAGALDLSVSCKSYPLSGVIEVLDAGEKRWAGSPISS